MDEALSEGEADAADGTAADPPGAAGAAPDL